MRKFSLVSVVTVAVISCGLLVSHLIAQPSSQVSEVSVAYGTGFGATGIYARTFGRVVIKAGQKITYVPDSLKGDSFVINAAGLYALSYTDGDPGFDDDGISKNLSAISPFSSVWGTGRELCLFGVSNSGESCSVVTELKKGDVIRAANTFSAHGQQDPQPAARLTITALP
jgi:hypothetical protein